MEGKTYFGPTFDYSVKRPFELAATLAGKKELHYM